MLLDLLLLGVIGLNVFALALVLLRAPLYRVRVYRPMLLNLALSVLPVLVLTAVVVVDGILLAGGAPPWVVGVVSGAGLLAWVVLLPNAGYLVTELNLNHRREGEDVPLWYDIVAVLTLAMSGVLNTVVNVFLAQALYAVARYPHDDAPFRRTGSWLVVAGLLLLVAFGIYLGRYVRFNSWDLLHPLRFARRLATHFGGRGVARDALLFCVLHATFLALMYVIVVGPITTLLVAGE
ncbi:DUF1361 domain-containing protein [Cellulosimicrobium marinum]|uniref:DUF1361 domain-containing protein n=1 Tax=Cellulosimicrobium marinum TaxID=1638992 RepID=UPI001E2EF257|nr:DUF1361 domain-containing protein [Cellulosimicrobium marinum]MCB7136112.1 DUF1361 domain-containing protein [Cellulosimicrobium marinum]